MKKRFSITILQIFLLFAFIYAASLPVYSQTATPFSINDSPLGAPTSPVMDYAGVLDANTKQAIERKIIAFRDASNPRVELAVAIVQTTGDREIFDYSLAVARGWKIGSKEQDNPGALLLIAVGDRKYYTQVSCGRAARRSGRTTTAAEPRSGFSPAELRQRNFGYD